MQQLWQNASSLLWSVISSPTIADIIDIIIVAFLIYKLMTWTRDTRASQVLKGLGMLFLAYWASDWLGFKALNWILQLVVNSGAVVIVVLFQSELRRALEQIGRAGSTRIDRIRARDHTRAQDSIISELVSALTNLSRRRVGALVVIEQRTGLNDVIESGTRIDAEVSAPLIENIFEPNTPLHDGAMIVRGYRIEAAACILTLSEDTGISRELGTRHRAALGISETTDSVTLIVSEETGIISMARDGRLTRHLDARSLRQILENLYGSADSGGINLLALLLAKPKPRHRAKGKIKNSEKK
ncbi:MAG: diadenylate cyclase CdaA [Oscillospiraceae bacterium]|jgi:diadenylate cyclase|nr:diadenylate cyclase CdaA [Oscillospiraceae bacterium]